MTENEEAFLRDYVELIRRHGVAIGGCGCCGSPFLVMAKKPAAYVKHLREEAA